jgi:hypothetical protein
MTTKKNSIRRFKTKIYSSLIGGYKMRILQVKDYHREIASHKYQKSDQKIRSMFYFLLTDNKGYPTEERKKGYIAFDENKAVYGRNKEEAERRFLK